jgi:hypothetical protein
VLSYLYGRIIGKPRDYVQKENGFSIFKLYKQRLFSLLFPVLIDSLKSNKSNTVIQLVMHTCSLVSLTSLHDKLPELIPIAEEAL